MAMDYKKLRSELIRRTGRYAEGVSSLYDVALADIAKVFALVDYDPTEPFSFEACGKFGRVDEIMRRLESQIQGVVEQGIMNEFGAAYSGCDELIRQVLGERVSSNVAMAFAPKVASGNAAKRFIQANRDGDITHSLRVWNGVVLGQMETAVEEGLMDGMPAKRMATLLKEYLVEPDDCFRRFRIKTGVDADGKSMYGRKWKKRRRNDDGTFSWFDADPRNYPVGSGVYHSSYKNALRYARTTTNIAYRTADYDRYQEFPFVIGIEIHTSNNPHHVVDICDMLAGRYPKEFKWTGWHPQCMCYQVPLLANEGEVDEMVDAILDGEDPSDVPVQEAVIDVPQNFKDWVKDNDERIANAKNLPYFLRDNGEKTADGFTLRVGNNTPVDNTQYVSIETPVLSSKEESMAYMQQLLNIGDGEATNYLDAIDYFVGNGYVKVREYQQRKEIGTDVERIVEPISDRLERLIRVSPKYKGVTFRGLNVDKSVLQHFIDLADGNDVITMNGTSSWSTEEMTAKYFAAGDEKRVIFRCYGKQLGTSIRAYAANPHEHEILVSREAKWRITGYKTIHGVVYFDVVLI